MVKEQKDRLIKDFQAKEGDTGSSSVQIALMTHRIEQITKHLQKNKKDFASRRGLLRLVSHRRGLLDYISRKDKANYEKLLERLKLRK
ncbi:MAG: 30S ribosomal protein S15 [Verrucomicrobiae bacterium]|nr:30S ribosomal protein S15 [Verrucomicrobiae bacterium]